MEDRIEELEYRICELERRLNDPWRSVLDEFVRERIRNYYHYGASYDSGLYDRVLEEMKDKIRKILVEDE